MMNEVKYIITNGVIKAEKSLKPINKCRPLSSDSATSILEVSL